MRKSSFLVKLLVAILIVLTLFNFISSTNIEMNYSFATGASAAATSLGTSLGTSSGTSSLERFKELWSAGMNDISIGLWNFFKSCVLAPFRAARSLNYMLASSGGTTGGTPTGEISPFDIFFNRFTLLDANIFSTTDRDGNSLDTGSLVYKIRTNAAVWYYAIRTLAIAIIAIMLIWNLVRAMSKSTSAGQKIVAKNALTDWVLSFALVMFMHIIIIVVLNFNDILLDGIQGFVPSAGNTADFFDALENAVFDNNITLGITALIVYALLNWQTLKYILVYIQRLLTIVLLVMISPIVPVTYSTDRMRGGRGAALNSWLKELLFNVFIQVLHALVYGALVGVAMAALTTTSTITQVEDLGTAVVAITAMLFIKYAERMVKTIFGFDSSQVLNNNVISEAVTNVGNTVSRVGSVVGGAGARVAQGGPLISFGKNIDGSHIGVGQVAQGLANNVNSGVRFAKGVADNARENVGAGIKNAKESISQGIQNLPDNMAKLAGDAGAGIKNVGDGIASIPKNVKQTAGNMRDAFVSGIKGERGSDAEATAEAEAEARAEAYAENGEDGKDGETIIINNAPESASEEPKIDNSQNDYMASNDEEDDDKDSYDKLRKAIEVVNGGKNKLNNKDVNNTKTEEVSEVREEIHTEERTEIINGENPTSNVNIENPIPVVAEMGVNPSVLDELKEGIDAIKTENSERIERMANEVNDQLRVIGENIDPETREEIESTVGFLIDDPEKLQDYFDKFKEGSDEQKYAKAFARFDTLMTISDESSKMSQEDKENMLMNTYNAQGLNIPENLKADDVGRLQFVSEKTQDIKSEIIEGRDNRATSYTETVNSTNEVNESSASSEVKIDEARNSRFINVKNQAMRDAQEALLKLGVDVKDEVELQADFEARIEKTTSSLNMKNPKMSDVIKSMDFKSQDEYRAYKSGKIDFDSVQSKSAINAIALEREFKAIEDIGKRARREGFDMKTEKTTYEATVDINGRKETIHSNSAQGVLTKLQDSKRNMEVTIGGKNKKKGA